VSYKEEVAKAVADPEWQKFRLSLKGESTKYKLEALRLYYVEASNRNDDLKDVAIRVYNYLTALARGGQIATTMNYVDDLENGQLKVLK